MNESNTVRMRSAAGDPIGIRQVSGAIARHIVCAASPGDRLDRAERFGLIKFGSTTELIMPRPESVAVRVKVGDRVKGGVTILARLDPESR